MPELGELGSSVGEAVVVVLVVQVVGGQLLTLLDVHHRSAAELVVVSGVADGVGGAAVVDDGRDRELN